MKSILAVLVSSLMVFVSGGVASADTSGSAASGVVWGYEVPSLVVSNQDDVIIDSGSSSYTPGELVGFTVQGIVDGLAYSADAVVVFVGTAVFVTAASVGSGLIYVGGVLPGPIGDILSSAGYSTVAAANTFAEFIHVGPYSTQW